MAYELMIMRLSHSFEKILWNTKSLFWQVIMMRCSHYDRLCDLICFSGGGNRHPFVLHETWATQDHGQRWLNFFFTCGLKQILRFFIRILQKWYRQQKTCFKSLILNQNTVRRVYKIIDTSITSYQTSACPLKVQCYFRSRKIKICIHSCI